MGVEVSVPQTAHTCSMFSGSAEVWSGDTQTYRDPVWCLATSWCPCLLLSLGVPCPCATLPLGCHCVSGTCFWAALGLQSLSLLVGIKWFGAKSLPQFTVAVRPSVGGPQSQGVQMVLFTAPVGWPVVPHCGSLCLMCPGLDTRSLGLGADHWLQVGGHPEERWGQCPHCAWPWGKGGVCR